MDYLKVYENAFQDTKLESAAVAAVADAFDAEAERQAEEEAKAMLYVAFSDSAA